MRRVNLKSMVDVQRVCVRVVISARIVDGRGIERVVAHRLEHDRLFHDVHRAVLVRVLLFRDVGD